MKTMKGMRTTILATLMTLSFNAMAQDANKNVGFPSKLFSDSGCSETYYKKAKKTNRIMGVTLGGAALLASAGSAPLSFVFVLGGIGMAADAGFDLAHKQWDDKVQEKFKMKANNETYPRVLYPIARGYFDALNTIEFSNMLKTETDEMEYAKIYIRSSVLAGQEKEKLKVCTSDAKLNGVSRGERKDIEKNLMDILMGMDEQRSLSAVDQAKKDYAECLMAIQSDVDESFPVADMLLAKIELQGKNLINRKMKGVVRNYNYVYKIAKAQGRDISIDDYFTKVSELNESQAICSSHKRPLKRRKLAEQILK